MNCKKCGAVLNDTDVFCFKCGAMVERLMNCKKCGAKLREGASFCAECGTSVADASDAQEKHKPAPAFCIKCGARINEGADACTVCGMKYGEQQITIKRECSNKYAWLLATIPLSISMLLSLIALPTVGTTVFTCLLVLIANIVFFCLDKKELENSGEEPSGWMWTGIVLIPVYLFIRASKMKTDYSYAAVWCVLFFLSLFF